MENSFLFSAAAEKIRTCDESVTEETQINEKFTKDRTIFEEPEPSRRLPYFINKSIEATDVKPVFYGAHINQMKEITFTTKFPDGKCYTMVPSRRKKGIWPFLKNTKILNNRCRIKNGRVSCPARFLVQWNLDTDILENFTDLDVIMDMGKHFNN